MQDVKLLNEMYRQAEARYEREQTAHAKTRVELSAQNQAEVRQVGLVAGVGGTAVGVVVGLVVATLLRKRKSNPS